MTDSENQDPVGAASGGRPSEEAAHLLGSPENTRRVLAAIDRLEHGGGETQDLVDPSP
jgi:hypothetical protein